MIRFQSIYTWSLLFIFCSWFLCSCEPDHVCHQDLQITAQIILSADSISSQGDTIRYNQWDSIAVIGVGSTKGTMGNKLTKIPLELRSDTTLTSFLLLYHEQVDTLFVEHTPRIRFISMACGCAVYHTILQAWSSDPRIDSISIINSSVESTTQDNLCIYMHE
jgi:hypothetical protein